MTIHPFPDDPDELRKQIRTLEQQNRGLEQQIRGLFTQLENQRGDYERQLSEQPRPLVTELAPLSGEEWSIVDRLSQGLEWMRQQYGHPLPTTEEDPSPRVAPSHTGSSAPVSARQAAVDRDSTAGSAGKTPRPAADMRPEPVEGLHPPRCGC